MKAARATPGKVVDASVVVPQSASARLVQSGVVGIVRTLAYKPGAPESGDLTYAELQWHLANGLWVSVYQRVRNPNWLPSQCDGHGDAFAAASEATRIGFPDGCHLWQDWEGPHPLTTVPQAAQYCVDWASGCGPHYLAALYVGFDSVLSPEQLYALPHTSYGSDVGHRKVATRGVSWQQGAPYVLDGITFDSGEMQADLLGDLPMVAVG